MDKPFYTVPTSEDVAAFADRHLTPYRIQHGELVAKSCPFCNGGDSHDTETFYVSLTTGQYYCHRGKCGARGGWVSLLRKFGEAPNIQSVSQQFKPLPIVPLPRTAEIDQYFADRGISTSTLDAYQVGATDMGDIMFPFYIEGELIYAKYRKPVHHVEKKKEWAQAGAPPVLFGMDLCKPGEPLVITEGQCFPGNAEVLTPSGWVRFADYDGHSPVMAVDAELKGHFETPYAVVKKEFHDNLLAFRHQGSYSSVTTPDHSLVLMDAKGRIIKRQAQDIRTCTQYNIIPTVVHQEGRGVGLTDDQISLYLAVSADCSLDDRASGFKYVRFAVKKIRKYERMKGILDRLNIQYHDSGLLDSGYYYIGFRLPEYIQSKELPFSWVVDATQEQKDHILYEQQYWDGNKVNNRNQLEYNTTIYHNAVVMQSLAHTAGYMSTIMHRPKTWFAGGEYRHGVVYKVSILFGKHSVSIQTPNFVPERYDGIVYCVSVSTGMILVRQEEHISVSGNCDTLSLYEAGIRNVVSVPTGCENFQWVDPCYSWLEQFQKIVFFGDNDPPGRKMVNTLVKRLGEERCFIVENYPPNCKDANDILVQLGAQALLDTFASAKEVPIRGLVNLADVEDIDPTTVPRIRTMIPKLDDMINGMALGDITIFTGKQHCLAGR